MVPWACTNWEIINTVIVRKEKMNGVFLVFILNTIKLMNIGVKNWAHAFMAIFFWFILQQHSFEAKNVYWPVIYETGLTHYSNPMMKCWSWEKTGKSMILTRSYHPQSWFHTGKVRFSQLKLPYDREKIRFIAGKDLVYMFKIRLTWNWH